MTTLKIKQAYRGGYKGRPGWWLHFDYDEDGIEALKRAVEPVMRTWDAEKERWWVHEQAEPELLRIAPGLEAFKQQGVLF